MTGIPLYLMVILPPLIASIITGLFGHFLGKRLSHSLAIIAMLIATTCSYIVFYQVEYQHLYYSGSLYNWLTIGAQTFDVGILIDNLSAVMLVVVSTVSLLVH